MKVEIKLQPFLVPNNAIEDIGELKFQTRTYSLDLLDPHSLSDLCDQFRKDVFRKAGKSDPRIQGNIRSVVKAPDECYYGL